MAEKQLWYKKHRPGRIDDYVFKDKELKDRVDGWVHGGSLPHLILSGPPGTGKTTLALVLINHINNEEYLFINASLKRGIDTIRQDIVSFAENGGWGDLRVVVLDEADGLSLAAQDSLRGVMDTYSDSVRFVFTCNRIQGISEAIRSRATTVILDALDEEEFVMRLMGILGSEGYDGQGSLDALMAVTERCYPDLRKAIDTLQEAAGFDKIVVVGGSEGSNEKPWQEELRHLVGLKAPVATLRQFAAGLQGSQTEEALKFLYDDPACLEQLGLTPEKNREAYIIIAEALAQHKNMTYPEVNLVGALLKIQLL